MPFAELRPAGRPALPTAEASVARIGSWSVQLPGGEVSWSERHYEVLGLDPARVTPSVEAYLGVVHPDDLPRVRAHVERAPDHAQGRVAKIEHRIVTPQDTWVVDPVPGSSSGPAGSLITLVTCEPRWGSGKRWIWWGELTSRHSSAISVASVMQRAR